MPTVPRKGEKIERVNFFPRPACNLQYIACAPFVRLAAGLLQTPRFACLENTITQRHSTTEEFDNRALRRRILDGDWMYTYLKVYVLTPPPHLQQNSHTHTRVHGSCWFRVAPLPESLWWVNLGKIVRYRLTLSSKKESVDDETNTLNAWKVTWNVPFGI